MKPGDLKHIVEITDWTDAPSGNDGAIETQRLVIARAPANVKAMSDYQIASYRANISDRARPSHIITIRELADFEPHTKMWVQREYRGRRERFRVLGVKDTECGFMSIICALWRRDSDRLDPMTQELPKFDEGADGYDLRDIGW